MCRCYVVFEASTARARSGSTHQMPVCLCHLGRFVLTVLRYMLRMPTYCHTETSFFFTPTLKFYLFDWNKCRTLWIYDWQSSDKDKSSERVNIDQNPFEERVPGASDARFDFVSALLRRRNKEETKLWVAAKNLGEKSVCLQNFVQVFCRCTASKGQQLLGKSRKGMGDLCQVVPLWKSSQNTLWVEHRLVDLLDTRLRCYSHAQLEANVPKRLHLFLAWT